MKSFKNEQLKDSLNMVSVIIPTFQRADLLLIAVKSVQEQSYPNWELIIVDDGSTDNTFEVLKKISKEDDRIRFYSRPEERSKGANSCRNFGFEVSKGKYIKWMDSDDLLTKDCLHQQVEVLENNMKLNVCLGYGVFFNDKTNKLEENWSRSFDSNAYLLDHIKNKIRWPVGGSLWKKTFFKESPFNENLKNSQEWLMHSQSLIRLREGEIYNLKRIVYLIRRGNKRMSSSRSRSYFQHQAKARYILLLECKTRCGWKIYYNLFKQIFVFGFHSVKKFKNS